MAGEKAVESVIILGAGPAGLSAALYAARGALNPLVLTGLQPGGQASLTHTIENYPGFPDGVGGPELGDLFQQQAQRFGARLEFDSATAVDLKQHPFIVKTYNREFSTHSLIIATGASPVLLGVPGEKELTGQGVSYCATCDGWFFRGKNVMVIGGGDSALEEAIFLTRFVDKVTIVHRRDEFRAGAILQVRAKENPKITFMMDSVINEIKGEGRISTVSIEKVKTHEIIEHHADGVFIFIGHTPNTQLFTGELDLNERGYILINKRMETNIEGVFACGEAADSEFKQVITSAGMGAAAGIQAGRYLESKNIK